MAPKYNLDMKADLGNLILTIRRDGEEGKERQRSAGGQKIIVVFVFVS